MPESKRRRRKNRRPTPPRSTTGRPSPRKRPPSPPWFGGLILALFVSGIAWLVTYYTTNAGIGLQPHFGGWNIFVGFGFIVAGFALLTQWN